MKIEKHKTDCKRIQKIIFDYLTKELGDNRSELVRQHLKKCVSCSKVATEMQSIIELLQKASKEEEKNLSLRLSEKTKKRILWLYMHPFFDWIYKHHRLFSIIITIFIMILSLWLLKYIIVIKRIEKANRIELLLLTKSRDTKEPLIIKLNPDEIHKK